MYSLNKVQLIGNLTRDPEVKQIPSGQMVCTLGIATNRSWKDQSGNKQDATEFHNIVCWGKLAEIAGQYIKKGTKVYFEGRLQTRSWDDKETGKKQYKTEIVAENMIILTPKGMTESGQNFGGGIQESSPAPAAESSFTPAPAEDKISVEDLPF
ncbi:MAG: single-stranded DNA-binding protein [Candidatus Gracilibacteria bacterium]|nr:single-stranded DNA-binding protein [Candidatus Gracilibacteria bacterium]